MPPISPVEAPSELCTDNKATNGRYCRRCGKPLSGRQKDFCGFGPGSCHTLFYSEARKIGSRRVIPEDHRRDRILFGKLMTCGDRLNAFVQTAKRIMTADDGNGSKKMIDGELAAKATSVLRSQILQEAMRAKEFGLDPIGLLQDVVAQVAAKP